MLTSQLIQKEREIAMAYKCRICGGGDGGGGMSNFFHLSRQMSQVIWVKTSWHVSCRVQRCGDRVFFGTEERILILSQGGNAPQWVYYRDWLV